MTSIVFQRCQTIVQLCISRQFFQQIPTEELKQIIAQEIGGDPRTIKLYLSRLQYFGLMKKLSERVYQIHPSETDKPAVREQQETLDKAILKQWGIQE